MKIDEALIIFLKLRNNTVDKTKSGIYNKFITILLDLQQRDFTSNQKKDIEIKLVSLNLKNNFNPTKKDLNKQLSSFESFLTTKFSIISKYYYVNKGMAIWLFSSIILFFCFGQFSVIGALLVSIILGVVLDLEAKEQGRIIKTTDNLQELISIKEPLVANNFSEEKVEEEENHQRHELQNYRRKKLQQFGKVQTNQEEQSLKKHQY
jgi:hypothetical protein